MQRKSSHEDHQRRLSSSWIILTLGCASIIATVYAVKLVRSIGVVPVAAATLPTPTFATPASTPTPQPTITVLSTPAVFDLPLVNRWHPLKENQMPGDSQLVNVADYTTQGTLTLKSGEMRSTREAAQSLGKMMEAAKQARVGDFYLVSAYRGFAKQQEVLDETIHQRKQQGMSNDDAKEDALRTVARPGESEHHTGLAFDLMAMNSANTMEDFLQTPQGKWINQHCYEYGFIVRYKPEKASITGIDGEPWHIRYVGLEAAQSMQESGMCLEEYLGAAEHSNVAK